MVAWSPTGKRIAWYSGRRFWIANRDGSDARSIARPADNDCCSSLWWPRRNVLLYEDDFRIFKLTTRGRTSRPIAALGAYLWIDRRGTVGATESPRGPSPLQLLGLAGKRWVRGVDRGGRLVLDQSATFSPDGRRVAFARSFCKSADDCSGSSEIWQARIPRGQTNRLLGAGTCPSWAPNGKQLLFVGPDGAFRLTQLRSTESTVVLENVASEFTGPCALGGVKPTWSHDSRYVAYLSAPNALTLSILQVSESRVQSFPQLGNVVQYAWSPVSDELLAVSLVRRGRSYRPCTLWLVDVRRSNVRPLHRCAG